jgi:hypothetical protein
LVSTVVEEQLPLDAESPRLVAKIIDDDDDEVVEEEEDLQKGYYFICFLIT